MKMDPDEARRQMADMRANLPALVELVLLNAELTRVKFNALMKQGFTEKQALELCRTNSVTG